MKNSTTQPSDWAHVKFDTLEWDCTGEKGSWHTAVERETQNNSVRDMR